MPFVCSPLLGGQVNDIATSELPGRALSTCRGGPGTADFVPLNHAGMRLGNLLGSGVASGDGSELPPAFESHRPDVIAIRARQMQKDQHQAAHTIPPSHSGRQASSRRSCCHTESAVASRPPNLAGRESMERHRRQLCVSETSLSAAPIEAVLNQPACTQSCDRARGAWCLGSSQSRPTSQPSWPWPRRE